MSGEVRIYRNEDVYEILAGIPTNHKHIRLVVRCRDGNTYVFQEATLAAIVRAYIDIKTHPIRRAVKYIGKTGSWKEGYAKNQLIETDEDENEILMEIDEIMDFKKDSK